MTQATFRNGYLQPETDPSHGKMVLIVTLISFAVLLTIIQTCIL
jgi:hypothetical protein